MPTARCTCSGAARCSLRDAVRRRAAASRSCAPGSIAGELGLFVDGLRAANVEAMTPCAVWALRGPRLEELGQRVPALALEMVRAAGAVMAARMRASLAKQAPFI